MKQLLAGTAVLALCALWVPSAAAADKPQPSTDVSSEVAKAQALRKAGQLPEAASALAQLMLVAPDDARVVGEYGKVMAQENRGDDALAFLQRAVQIDTSDWTLYSALGVAYDENNKPKDAAAAYQHALSLRPGEPSVLNNYAVSRMLSGDYAGAQAMMAQAQGSNDPRIVNNSAMLAEIEAGKAPARVAAPPPVKTQQTAAASKPTTQQASAQQASAQKTAMQPVQSPAPKPAPIAVATLADPKPAGGATGAPHNIVAAATLPSPQVVMQAVPKDPLAGPVKPRVMAHRVAAKKPTAPSTPAPALRTAADTR